MSITGWQALSDARTQWQQGGPANGLVDIYLRDGRILQSVHILFIEDWIKDRVEVKYAAVEIVPDAAASHGVRTTRAGSLIIAQDDIEAVYVRSLLWAFVGSG